MFNIFSSDFSQSSECSGSGELAKVGGLWLINSWCLSRGGSGGGVVAMGLALVAPSSPDASPLSLGASLGVPDASAHAYPP
jgi:hypothetical protein